MKFVERNQQGKVVTVWAEQVRPDLEPIADDHPDLAEFLPSYIDRRMATYIAAIGGGDVVKGFGNMFDALYWRERGDPSKWEAYLAQIDAIKAAIPKPE